MKNIILLSFVCILYLNLNSQQNPIWDVGTKWTYTLQKSFGEYTYATDEIVEVVFLDGKELYKVKSLPEWHGISYFYYEDQKVYNYWPEREFQQLLYDFDYNQNFSSDARPVCDPYFDYDNQSSKPYAINLDSLKDFRMPDGTSRVLKYYRAIDSIFVMSDTMVIDHSSRPVLDGIGFMEGQTHYTHHWEVGTYICDEFGNYIRELRCFETKDEFYNFVGYPCELDGLGTSIEHVSNQTEYKIHPNPSFGCIYIENLYKEVSFEIIDIFGRIINSGMTSGEICISQKGIAIVKIKNGDEWYFKKIIVK